MKSWDGKLTPEIRKALRAKRTSLGVSCKELGNLIGASESVVQKWEGGKVAGVSITLLPRLNAFLNGEFDEQCQQQWRKQRTARDTGIGETGATGGNQRPIPPELRAVFDHLSVVYKACRVKPEAQTELLLAVEKAAEDVLTRLAAGKTGK